MAKFPSPDDEDFRTVSAYLGEMVAKAPQKIADNWRQYNDAVKR